MKKFAYLAAALLLCASLLCGCGKSGDLLTEIKPNTSSIQNPTTPQADQLAIYDFSVQLFQQSLNADQNSAANTLISPLSVLMALGMITNGAEGETLAQMEEVFGITSQELNEYLRFYANNLPQTKTSSLSIANSIWLKDDPNILVKEEFLQTCAAYYNPDIYQKPFNSQTLAQINAWVKEKTDGMIEQILDDLSNDAVMYLINALAFEAEWETNYADFQVQQDIFTTADGRQQQVDFMYNDEQVYLQDENAQGFIKYYDDFDYAFVALLPNESVALEDYAASLSGEKLNALLNSQENTQVHTSLPKFESDYMLEMNRLLQNMGITDAFDPLRADFSGAAKLPGNNGSLYIDQVLHKTYIQVNESGTRAGAVTAETLLGNGMPPQDYREVYLNRPFVYLIIDCQNKLPLFIGTLNSVE